jgi:outer membrane protein assembly factor BamB
MKAWNSSEGVRAMEHQLSDILYLAFRAQVFALDRATGRMLWNWRASNGMGFVALLVDGDRLFASVNGYTYCLDPLTGRELWSNPLEGFGVGIPMLATARGTTTGSSAAAAQHEADTSRPK